MGWGRTGTRCSEMEIDCRTLTRRPRSDGGIRYNRTERLPYAIQAGTGNPFSFRNGTLNNFDAYRDPPSARIVTTVWPGPSDFATLTAAATLMPDDVPTDKPSWISRS